MKEQTNRSSQADYRFQNRIQWLHRWSPPRGGAGITCAIQLLSLSLGVHLSSVSASPRAPSGPRGRHLCGSVTALHGPLWPCASYGARWPCNKSGLSHPGARPLAHFCLSIAAQDERLWGNKALLAGQSQHQVGRDSSSTAFWSVWACITENVHSCWRGRGQHQGKTNTRVTQTCQRHKSLVRQTQNSEDEFSSV